MKATVIVVLVVLAGLATGQVAWDTEIAELREWTSTSGSRLRARFVLERDGLVILEGGNGRRSHISKVRLSLKDIAWIRQHLAGKPKPVDAEEPVQATGHVQKASAANELPVFADGQWQGLHAVYQSKNFDAVVGSRGGIKLYMKKDGKRVEADPFTIEVACKPDGGNRSSKRDIATFASPGEPALNPKELKFTGTLEDDIGFELKYTFSTRGVTAWGRATDPGGIAVPTRFRLQFRVPKAFEIEGQMPWEDQLKLMKGNYFVQRSVDGQERIRCEYYKRASLKRYCREVKITGPLYGGRTIAVQAMDASDAPLYLYVSPIGAPWEGYSMTMTKKDADSRDTRERINVIIR